MRDFTSILNFALVLAVVIILLLMIVKTVLILFSFRIPGKVQLIYCQKSTADVMLLQV